MDDVSQVEASRLETCLPEVYVAEMLSVKVGLEAVAETEARHKGLA